MSRRAFHDLLKRYLEGKCTAQEKQIVEQWYSMLDDDELEHLQDAELAAIDEKLWKAVHARINPTGQLQEEKPVRSLWIKLAVAASLIGVLITGYFMLYTPDQEFMAENTGNPVVKKINTSAAPLEIALEDGSTVILQPNTTLTYPERFTTARREVFVRGEAFFQVHKDPSRPFFVFSDNLVTQVVGTSFTVKSGDSDHVSEVAVHTGKVIVSKKESQSRFYEDLLSSKNKVVLTPNQMVVYHRQTKELVVTLVKQPVPLVSQNELSPKVEFNFNNTPLEEILKKLEKTYGIAIQAENDDVYQCTFTGDINDQDLYTRMDLICQAIGASYKIDGTEILILGGHCN